MATVQISSQSSEYDIRNSLSRLYYAFLHASLALLSATDPDIERVSKNHGVVHERIQGRFGKRMSRLVRELYDLRRKSDYETTMFSERFSDNIEEARKWSILLLKRVKTDFYWLVRSSEDILRRK
jgi:uncharacterized protein (UPF0332 family)